MDWLAGGIILISKWLLAEKRIAGWYLSIVGGILIIFVNIEAGIYGLAVMTVINLALSCRGIYVWRK